MSYRRPSAASAASGRRRSDGTAHPRVCDLAVEGPVAIVDSIAPVRSFAPKHVVHIIFAGDLGGRSLETVTSTDAAVRGHRLFAPDELDDVVLHPPIQRFLQRWSPGDPVVYLGALWAP